MKALGPKLKSLSSLEQSVAFILKVEVSSII